MEKGIKRCQEHNKASDTFCKTCKRITCEECGECEKHNRISIYKFVEKNKSFLQHIHLNSYKARAGESSKITTDKLAHNRQDMMAHVKEAKEIKKTISKSKEGEANDLKLVDNAIKHLRDIQDKAFTTVLRESVESAIHILDIDDKIETEISGHKAALEELKRDLKNKKRESKVLEWMREWLDTITKANESEVDKVELALSLCFANKTIKPSNTTHNIFGFRAFPSVNSVFDIKRVEKEELIEVGLGVKISRPVTVEKELTGGDWILSSLSHNGVLATYCCEASAHKYQLTDLECGRQINVEVGHWTHTGFYDNSMVMLTWNKLLGVCSVEEMFLHMNVGVLESIGAVRIHPWTDVSLIHSTRLLVFSSASNIPYEFNVDTKVISELDIGKKIYSFACLTGIDIGVKGVFMEYESNGFAFSINNDNTTSLVSGYNSGIPCTFIPSSSDPRDFKKGMKLYFNGSFFTSSTEGAQLVTPFKYQYIQSIVRLYQDVFLIFDANTKKWCLVKIMVP